MRSDMATITISGDAAIQRRLSLSDDHSTLTLPNVEETFEINKCARWITDRNYCKVGLQFPDELLQYAPTVATRLRMKLGFHVYILADTTFSSCCVDEVAAEHVGADSIIHFGRCCLSPCQRLPVLYILSPFLPSDIHAVALSLSNSITDHTCDLILTYDTRCSDIAESLYRLLKSKFPNIQLSRLIVPGEQEPSLAVINEEEKSKCIEFNGRSVLIPDEKDISLYTFLYIGPLSATLNCLALKFPENVFHQINALNGDITTISMTKTIMQRSGKLEQIKDSNIIGILMGTLGKLNYLEIVKQLKKLIKSSGKKSYTFVVGKPNEAKLANIPEVDVYVYVACPETSLIQRSFDPALYKKLVTPWEVELALNSSREWAMEFVTDFTEFLPNGSKHCEVPDGVIPDDRVSVSLLTNKTQYLGIRSSDDDILDSQSGAVVLKDEGTLAPLHVGGAGALLNQRSWAGLDPSVPSEYPLQAVQGRQGIASGYINEKSE